MQLLQEAERDPLDTDLLAAAVELYAGGLLPGSYEEWLLAQRRQLERSMLAALQKLITLLENRRACAEAIPYAQRLLELDPLSEASCLSLMRLHAEAGQRTEALRVYHDCAATLRDELDVEPSAELALAYRRIIEAEGQPEPMVEASPEGNAPELIGREREWETLRSAWERALHGTAQMAVISGEAGFGKTRLAEEFLQWAGHQGAITARTRSFASYGALVYAPVAELLRQDALKRRLAMLDGVWLSEIARLLPELVETGHVAALPQPMTEPWQRQRLLQALVRAVTVGDQPAALLIDDLQWCDQETIQWLAYLLHDAPQARLLIVGTVRSEEINDQHPYNELQLDLTRAEKLTEIPVALLGQADTLALAEQVAGSELAPEQADAIWEISSGNPLFVVETVRHWAESDEFVSGELEAAPQQPDSRVMRLPPKVYGVIRSRLTQLSPPAREVISLAATVGRSFSYPVLATAGEQDQASLVDSLEEALKHRIVLEQGDAYDFGHDRIRDVAYAEISRARRRLLHGRVAVAIESVHAANLDEVSGELAHHHEQAGNLGQAAGYLRRAGQRVAAQFAHEEAVAYYTRALALLPETEPEKRIELLLLREAIYTLQTDKKKRYGDVQEMLRLVESLEVDAAKIDRYRARIKLRQVMYVGSQGNVQEAIRLAESAVTLAQAAGATDIEAEAYWYWGRELWEHGNLEEAIPVLEKSIRLARQAGDDDLEARALEVFAAAGAFSGAPTSRILGQLGRCMEIHQQNGNLFGQAAIRRQNSAISVCISSMIWCWPNTTMKSRSGWPNAPATWSDMRLS